MLFNFESAVCSQRGEAGTLPENFIPKELKLEIKQVTPEVTLGESCEDMGFDGHREGAESVTCGEKIVLLPDWSIKLLGQRLAEILEITFCLLHVAKRTYTTPFRCALKTSQVLSGLNFRSAWNEVADGCPQISR